MRFMFARLVLITALTAILPLSAGAQDACTVDSGTHVGSPACPYQWVGATTVLYDGSGNGLGFIGMTSQCRADFGPGARMCQSREILESDTHHLNAIPLGGCWIRPTFVTTGLNGLDMSGLQIANGEPDRNTDPRLGVGRAISQSVTATSREQAHSSAL